MDGLSIFYQTPMDGLSIFYQTGFASNCKSFFEAGLIAGGKGEVKVDKRASLQQWTPWVNTVKINYVTNGNHDWCRIEPSGRIWDCSEKVFTAKDRYFGKQFPMPLSSTTPCQLTVS